MVKSHEEPSISRLNAFGLLEQSEIAGLANFTGPERTLDRNAILWEAGKKLPALFVLLDGWMASTVAPPDHCGVTIKVHLPGDILGLPSLAFAEAAETAVALTRAKLRPLPFHSFGQLFAAYPRVAAMMFLVSQQERMDLTDRLVARSTADTAQRLADFMVRLYERVKRSFPNTGEAFFMPLSQRQVADLIGATMGQMTQALKKLRDAEALSWSDRFVTVADEATLNALGRTPRRLLAHDPYWLPTIEGTL